MTWDDQRDRHADAERAHDVAPQPSEHTGVIPEFLGGQAPEAASPEDTGAFLTAAAQGEKGNGATPGGAVTADAPTSGPIGLHSAPQQDQIPTALGAFSAADENGVPHSEDALFAAPAPDAASVSPAEGDPIGLHAKPADGPEGDASPLAAGADPEDALFARADAAQAASEAAQGAYSAPVPQQEALFSSNDAGAEAVADATAAPAFAETPAAEVLPGQDALFASEEAPAQPSASTPAESAPAAGDGTAPLPLFDGPAGTADAAADPSLEDTAEIDVEAVEAKLNDPGTTMSFEPLPEERIDTSSTYDAGTTTELTWGARSDVGCVRSHNEDSYLVQSPLFCVSDGMGGHAAGEVASSIAVETIAKTAPTSADPALLGAAVESANAAVIEAAANGRGKPGMGCTATVAYIEGHTLAIAHVGDSRAYLLHNGMLIRVTHDHSLVEELVDAGEITADEARNHPNRSVITRALGSDPHMYADHFTLNIEKGDRLILCSDGLSGMIPDRDIESIAQESSTAQLAADNLVDAALAAGGADNVTVVVVDVMDDGRMKELRRRRRRNVLIGAGIVLALLVACAVALAVSITGSIYLGVKDGNVAVYRGIPATPLGLELHWLEDETSVEVDELPEDTQARLEQGILQNSLDEAQNTIANYRDQIDSQHARDALTAQTLQEQQDGADAQADGADTGAADAGSDQPADAAADNAADQAAPAEATDPAGAGGAA